MEYVPIIVGAKYMGGHKIVVEFDNGEKRLVDCYSWLNGEVFRPLKEKRYFRRFFVDGWSIAWPNGVDFAPETLYESGIPV